MNIHKVYCETNSYIEEIKKLDKKNIRIYHFPFETTFKKAEISKPSALMFGEHIHPFSDKYHPFIDFNGSNKYDLILATIGNVNQMDALHLDSAYKEGCAYFLTKDKTDIVSKRKTLEILLNLRIFDMNSKKDLDTFWGLVYE